MKNYQKILIAAVIVLVLLNGALMAFIWTNRPDRSFERPGRGMDRPQLSGRVMLERLNFTDEQAMAFRSRLKAHHQQMARLERKVRDAKKEVNRAIILSDSVALQKATLALQHAHDDQQSESGEFMSFLAGLCTAEQRQELLGLLEVAFQRRGPAGR